MLGSREGSIITCINSVFVRALGGSRFCASSIARVGVASTLSCSICCWCSSFSFSVIACLITCLVASICWS